MEILGGIGAILTIAGFLYGVLKWWRGRESGQRQRLSEAKLVYVDGARMDFSSGDRPTVFVRVQNDRAIVASNVRVALCMDAEQGKKEDEEPQRIDIPAGRYREVYMRSPFVLNEERLNTADRPLEIKGWMEHGDHRRTFCYRFNRWDGARPREVPMFTPCDSIPRQRITVPLGVARTTARAFGVSAVQTPSKKVNATIESFKDPNNEKYGGDATDFALCARVEWTTTFELSARLTFLFGSEREVGKWPSPVLLPIKGKSVLSETLDVRGTVRFLVARRRYSELMLCVDSGTLLDTRVTPDNGRSIDCEIEFLFAPLGTSLSEASGPKRRYRISWAGVSEP